MSERKVRITRGLPSKEHRTLANMVANGGCSTLDDAAIIHTLLTKRFIQSKATPYGESTRYCITSEGRHAMYSST